MFVLISTELSQRELEAHLLLGNILNGYGANVLICYDQVARKLVPELCKNKSSFILIDKSGSPTCIPKRLEHVKNNENAIAFLILQESFINLDKPNKTFEVYTQSNIDEYVEKIFTFGNAQKDLLISAHPHLNNITFGYGNPRHDLLTKYRYIYRKKIAAIKELYGDYILYTDAHPLPENHLSPMKADHGNPPWKNTEQTTKQLSKELENMRTHNRKYLDDFLSNIQRLSNDISPKHIIIRPHPVNLNRLWTTKVELLRNIHVIRDFSCEPWILAAEKIITSGCTTGVQAMLARKPVISYDPIPDSPTALSRITPYIAKNYNELIGYASSDLAFKTSDKEQLSYLTTSQRDCAEKVAQSIISTWKKSKIKDKDSTIDFSKYAKKDQPWKWEQFETEELQNLLDEIGIASGIQSKINKVCTNTYILRSC